jgi:hypothetical protein
VVNNDVEITGIVATPFYREEGVLSGVIKPSHVGALRARSLAPLEKTRGLRDDIFA